MLVIIQFTYDKHTGDTDQEELNHETSQDNRNYEAGYLT